MHEFTLPSVLVVDFCAGKFPLRRDVCFNHNITDSLSVRRTRSALPRFGHN